MGTRPVLRERRTGTIVSSLAITGISVAVMQTLLIPVLTDLPALLHTTPTNATWLLTSTLLASAVSTPIMGRLGDLFGKRRILLTSLAVMVVGSLVCAFTDSLIVMITGRALQGFGTSAIPLGIGILRDKLPREKLGSAMALMSSSIGVGSALGLPAAALVAQNADWHFLFFGSAAIGVLSMALTFFLVAESPVRAAGTFDWRGALGLSGGLVALLLAITKGSLWGWGSTTTLGLFTLAAVILLLWGVAELKVATPLVDLQTTARREVLLTNLAAFMLGVAFYVVTLVLPQLLQTPASAGYGLDQSMVVAGLCVAPIGIMMILVTPVYAWILAKYGPKVALVIGMIVMGIGYGAGIGLMSAVWQTVVISVVVGAGIGFAYSSLPALIVKAVDPTQTGAATGMNTLTRSVGTSMSSAIMGVVLAHTSERAGAVVVPTISGFRISFGIAIGALFGGLVLAAFIPSQQATNLVKAVTHEKDEPSTTQPTEATEAHDATH
ncbi:MFS transporter [Streptomyces sp. CA-106110]|uniref:MFS transporter n=1 Tax=Streptomyces sp. CA-106110 TaxID=3240044 RepID=UPI003D8A2B44